MAETVVYLGPSIDGLQQNTTFKGGVPLSVTQLLVKYPDIAVLLVTLTQASLTLQAIRKPGTPEYLAYRSLGGTDLPTDGSTGGGGDDRPGTGPIDVTLQDKATAPGNGTSYTPTRGSNETLTFDIFGTSTSRTVVFEMAGINGVYVPCTAFSVTNPTKFGTQTTGGTDAAPESWQVEVPAGYSFRTRAAAVAGGNVTVKGKSVM